MNGTELLLSERTPYNCQVSFRPGDDVEALTYSTCGRTLYRMGWSFQSMTRSPDSVLNGGLGPKGPMAYPVTIPISGAGLL